MQQTQHQMKLSALLLPTLLALSSAAPQDFDKREEQRNVSSLSNALEDHPEIAAKASMKHARILSLSRMRQKRSVQSSSVVSDDGTILEWVTWNNSLPNDTVSTYTDYVHRTDYICKYKCDAGLYNPKFGSYCIYPRNKKEFRGFPFEVLVNKDNFETLEWKDSSNGSPIQNAIRTCPGVKVYVGKNKYGLGKVVTQDKRFYLPYMDKEYWYNSYQVLTISENIVSQQIDNVVYNTDKSEIIRYPPEIIRETAITNYECSPVVKTDSLSKTYQVEQRWDNTYSVRFGVKTSFKAGVPFIAEGGIEISTDVTLQFNRGGSVVESITDTVSVEIRAPPNHRCTATMMRYKYKLNIPYTARLSRTYGNGEVRTVIITGTYDSVQVGEVRAVVHRCKPVADAKSCPEF
ncbi:natterin-3-like isoform X2 [Acanthochromis polyacanthus]|uniref:natterin-3-like isoform X2 n=1 Tax=Acanthochromis polyacanthus TaxID=80966 RepID=UPI00223464D8|nr:natterin-3-like isoform X2 [Acanthochromis polyacanthus]